MAETGIMGDSGKFRTNERSASNPVGEAAGSGMDKAANIFAKSSQQRRQISHEQFLAAAQIHGIKAQGKADRRLEKTKGKQTRLTQGQAQAHEQTMSAQAQAHELATHRSQDRSFNNSVRAIQKLNGGGRTNITAGGTTIGTTLPTAKAPAKPRATTTRTATPKATPATTRAIPSGAAKSAPAKAAPTKAAPRRAAPKAAPKAAATPRGKK